MPRDSRGQKRVSRGQHHKSSTGAWSTAYRSAGGTTIACMALDEHVLHISYNDSYSLRMSCCSLVEMLTVVACSAAALDLQHLGETCQLQRHLL
jgi:hypothetical protein